MHYDELSDALVQHGIVHPDAIDDKDGWDGGNTRDAVQALAAELDLAANPERRDVIESAIDMLDGNVATIDWRDQTQPELLRKLCEHLEVFRVMQAQPRETCRWTDNGEGGHRTECGEDWPIAEGGTMDGVRFCPFCGGRIEV